MIEFVSFETFCIAFHKKVWKKVKKKPGVKKKIK